MILLSESVVLLRYCRILATIGSVKTLVSQCCCTNCFRLFLFACLPAKIHLGLGILLDDVVHLNFILIKGATGAYVTSKAPDQSVKIHNLGPVVQSVVSLTSSLRVISLTVLVDSIHNILIFFAEKM